MVSDGDGITELAACFQNLGADEPQARRMAAQTLKRARQLAVERGISEAQALSELLEKIVAGACGTYGGTE